MTTPAVPNDVHARLARLEAQHRRLRQLAAGAALAGVTLLLGAAAPRPAATAESRVVLTAPNGQTTATLELRDDGALAVRITGVVVRAGIRSGQRVAIEVPVRGDFAFVPGYQAPSDPLGSPRLPEVRVLDVGRVVAYLGGSVARPLTP